MRKCAQFQVKAVGPDDDLQEGQFIAYASVFGNKDSYGDVVMPGAFADTLKEWEQSADVIPLLWGHNMDDPDYNIGHLVEASEDDRGLLVKASLDFDSPKAQQVYRLIKGHRVNQMSFAYDVLEGGWEKREKAGAAEGEEFYALRKLKLYEVSVVPIGANQETELLAVKAAGEHARSLAEMVKAEHKAGRTLSAKTEATLAASEESLVEALQGVRDVLATVREAADDQEKASGTGPATTQEPFGATVQEPSPNPSAKTLAAEMALLALMGEGEGGSL